jgi:hypothetical protein
MSLKGIVGIALIAFLYNAAAYASNEVPLKKGMSFVSARRLLLKQQWRPQKTMRTTEHFAVDKALLKQHIVEVEVCTVDSFCIFRYVKNGKCLKLVAHGEDLNGLTVSTWDNSCPEQAMTK